MTQHTQVLYNARCLVCRAEIAHYAGYVEAKGLPVTFQDLNAGGLEQWGIDPDQAARRLHVRQGGRVLSGVEAFAALWAALPRYRWAARIVALPGLRQVASLIYERVLAPRLYAKHLAREAKRAAS